MLKLINHVKVNIGVLKSVIIHAKGDRFDCRNTTVLGDKHVVVSNELMALVGGGYAAMEPGYWGFRTVVVNDAFFNLPQAVQEFIYYHEEGHLVLNHVADPTRAKVAKEGGISKQEQEADAYAASVVGKDKAVAALFYVANDYRSTYGNGVSAKELERRAKLLIS